MKALIFKEKVVQVQETTFEVAPELIWIDCPDDCVPGWSYIAGVLSAPVVPEKTLDELLIEFSQGIQEYIDAVARLKNYESGLHCATYATSTIESWKLEAQAFIAWRDGVWSYSYGELAKFQNGERQAVTVDEFLTELPAIDW